MTSCAVLTAANAFFPFPGAFPHPTAEPRTYTYTYFRCNQYFVDGFDGGGDAKDGSKGNLSGSAAVEAEHDFTELELQVMSA